MFLSSLVGGHKKGKEMPFSERRRFKRIEIGQAKISLRPLDPQIWFMFWDGLEYTLRDISLVGIGLYSKEVLPEGTPLSIDLRLNKEIGNIRVFGKVAWIKKDENGWFRTGVSFSWWKDEQDKKLVRDFSEQNSSAN